MVWLKDCNRSKKLSYSQCRFYGDLTMKMKHLQCSLQTFQKKNLFDKRNRCKINTIYNENAYTLLIRSWKEIIFIWNKEGELMNALNQFRLFYIWLSIDSKYANIFRVFFSLQVNIIFVHLLIDTWKCLFFFCCETRSMPDSQIEIEEK